MTVNIAAFTAALEAVAIAGVTVKDTDAVGDQVLARDCPVLYPEPRRFVTNMTMNRDTYGYSTNGLQTVEYDLTYTYCHAQAGEGRGIKDHMPANVTNLALIIETINTTEFATIANARATVSDCGPVEDPAGAIFHGGHVVIHITEFLEV